MLCPTDRLCLSAPTNVPAEKDGNLQQVWAIFLAQRRYTEGLFANIQPFSADEGFEVGSTLLAAARHPSHDACRSTGIALEL